MERLLVIDNYDSFTFNLVQMFRRYPLDIRVFCGLPRVFKAARYHSLMVRPRASAGPYPLAVTTRSEDNVIMGLSHREYPLHGVQFHPESFMTRHGSALIENFLRFGLLGARMRAASGARLRVDPWRPVNHACA